MTDGSRKTAKPYRTTLGREVEQALAEVLDHVRGEKELPGYDIETADSASEASNVG